MTPVQAQAAVARLEQAELPDLRATWVSLYGAPHPPVRSPDLLRRLLAWRIQAAAFGGLDRDTRRVLASKSAAPVGPRLTPGVRLTREWRGRPCDVEVVDGGFLFEGKRFASLSEVAREITGVRWNGPRFFGLRKGKS